MGNRLEDYLDRSLHTLTNLIEKVWHPGTWPAIMRYVLVYLFPITIPVWLVAGSILTTLFVTYLIALLAYITTVHLVTTFIGFLRNVKKGS